MEIFTPRNIAVVLSIGTAVLITISFFNESEKRELNQLYEQQIEQAKKVNEEAKRSLQESREVLDRLQNLLDR